MMDTLRKTLVYVVGGYSRLQQSITNMHTHQTRVIIFSLLSSKSASEVRQPSHPLAAALPPRHPPSSASRIVHCYGAPTTSTRCQDEAGTSTACEHARVPRMPHPQAPRREPASRRRAACPCHVRQILCSSGTRRAASHQQTAGQTRRGSRASTAVWLCTPRRSRCSAARP